MSKNAKIVLIVVGTVAIVAIVAFLLSQRQPTTALPDDGNESGSAGGTVAGIGGALSGVVGQIVDAAS